MLPGHSGIEIDLNPGGVYLAVGGEFNELLNITGIIPFGVDLLPYSGIYMCEVCTDRGRQSDECHTANCNVTLHVIGGQPFIDKAMDSGIPIYMQFKHTYG